MKFLKYLLVWFCVGMLLASVAGYVYIRLRGKELFENQFEKFFGQPASIQSVRYLVPAGIRFHKLKIHNVLEADDVFLHLRVPFLLERQFIIASLELVKPAFQLVRHEKKQIDFGGSYLKQQEERFQKQKKPGSRIRGILADFISIKDGRIDILDLAVNEPVKYSVEQINGKAMNVAYPLIDQDIKFDIEGQVLTAGREHWLANSAFSAAGWINWPARAMDLDLDFQAPGGVKRNVNLKGENNIVHADGRLEIDTVDKSSDGKAVNLAGGILPDVVFEALLASGSQLGINFNFKTKMDEFPLPVIEFEGRLDLPRDKKGLDALNPALFFNVDWPEVRPNE